MLAKITDLSDNCSTMHDAIFQIYGALIIAFVGFVLPLIAIALSILGDGVKSLKENYENKQKQAEANLTEEIKNAQTQRILTSKL